MKLNSDDKHFAVIGLGRFGSNMAISLYQMGYDVLAVDYDMKKVQRFSSKLTHVIQADSTDENSLRELEILNFDAVVVAISENIEANIMTTLQLKSIGVKYIIAIARNALQIKVLEKIGADRVIVPERDMAKHVAYNLASTNVIDYIELSGEYSIAEITVPKIFINKTLAETNVRTKYNINVVAVKRGSQLIVTPMPTEKICENDVFIVIGTYKNINKLEKIR